MGDFGRIRPNVFLLLGGCLINGEVIIISSTGTGTCSSSSSSSISSSSNSSSSSSGGALMLLSKVPDAPVILRLVHLRLLLHKLLNTTSKVGTDKAGAGGPSWCFCECLRRGHA